MDWQLIVPGETGWNTVDWENARDVRLRPGQGAAVTLKNGVWRGGHILSSREITQAAQALSHHELAARQEELRRGFLPLPGGHRLGVCGVMGEQGLLQITSLCVRLAHEIRGAGETVFPLIQGRHTLIIGPPGSGKTTLLRDLIRLYALHGAQVSVADERGEIAACRSGVPQLDVGPQTDVMTGLTKHRAIPLLIRAMAPQVIAADEIGGPEDGEALLAAMRCGVTVLATAHGNTVKDVCHRPGIKKLVHENGFEKTVLLRSPGEAPRVADCSEGE